jgi:arylformamidase
MLSRQDSNFVVEGLRECGAVIIVLSYRLIPHVALDDVVADVYSATRWVASNAGSFGGDSERLFVSGHSAGAHLCAMIVQEQGKSLPAGLINGAILASGNYELEPIRLSARNKLLSLDRQCVARNSPTRLVPPTNTHVSIVWGEQESGQYKEQARDLAAAWRAHGVRCDERELPHLNHLDVPLALVDPQSALSKIALDQMAG